MSKSRRPEPRWLWFSAFTHHSSLLEFLPLPLPCGPAVIDEVVTERAVGEEVEFAVARREPVLAAVPPRTARRAAADVPDAPVLAPVARVHVAAQAELHVRVLAEHFTDGPAVRVVPDARHEVVV